MIPDKLINACKSGGGFIVISGAFILLGASPITDILPEVFADIIYWPFDWAQTITEDTGRLLSAICGGVMIGWGVMYWMLAENGLRQAPQMSHRIMTMSLLTWFASDSIASIIAGAPLNALSNCIYLAILGLPLLKLAPYLAANTDQNTAFSADIPNKP